MIFANVYRIECILSIFIRTITLFTELNGFVHNIATNLYIKLSTFNYHKIKLYLFENIY